MMRSNKNQKTILIGAGFPLALDYNTISTANFLKKLKEDSEPSIIQILLNLEPILSAQPLNYFWEAIDCMCKNIYPSSKEGLLIRNRLDTLFQNLQPHYFKNIHSYNKRLNKLFNRLHNGNNRLSYPVNILVMIGVELKYYLLKFLQPNTQDNTKTTTYFNKIEIFTPKDSETINWVNLNYDLCLERCLKDEYCYPEFSKFEKTNKIPHKIMKPHGSLNVFFNTNKNNEHTLTLSKDLGYLSLNEIGLDKEDIEHRPWVIGYLSDTNKDEINNSLTNPHDKAHKMCLTHQKLSIKAINECTKLFILGYSLPVEDQWIIDAINKSSNIEKIFVASGSDTSDIISKLTRDNVTPQKWNKDPFGVKKKSDL